MGSFTEKIRVLLDVDSSGADSSFKKFRTSVSEADGVTGKFKAGASGAFQAIKDNAGAMALGAGTALVAFGIKSVHAFEDTAKAALDLGAATGLATEDASRWIAVGDDFEISADQLQSGIGKIAKSLDDTKWDKYGIATHDAAGKARSANDILIDSLATLSEVKNETERARIGNELFGKGYTNLAPLIGHTRDEYKKMLGAVEDGQVITDKEADKAEKMRLAEDALADALKEVMLAVGQAVAGLAPYISKLATIIGYLEKIPHLQELAFGPVATDAGSAGDALRKMAEDAIKSGDAIQYLVDKGFKVEVATNLIKEFSAEQEATKEDTEELTDAVTMGADQQEYYASRVAASNDKLLAQQTEARKSRDRQNELSDAVERGKDALALFNDQLAAYLGQLSDEKAYLNLQQSIDDTKQKIIDLWNEEAKGAITHEESTRQQRLAWIALGEEVANTGTIIGLNSRDIKILVELADNGQIDDMNRRLDIMARNRTMNVSIEANGGNPYPVDVDGRRVAGGPVRVGGSYVVGEKGPEIVTFGASGMVTPNNALGGPGGSGGNTYNINVHSADPGQIIQLIKQYERRNGAGWRGN